MRQKPPESRCALLFTVLLAAGACASCAAVPQQPILGTWQSDEALTLASMREIGGLSPEAVALFEADFFGHLIVQYRRTTVRSRLVDDNYDTGFQPYEVLEATSRHVTIRSWDPTIAEWLETTLYIDGDLIYALTGRTNFREYFRRLSQ